MTIAAALILAYTAGLLSGFLLAAALHGMRPRIPPRPPRSDGDWPDDGHW